MLGVLQQFYKALLATMTAYKHTTAVQEKYIESLNQQLKDITEQLRAITVERDLLLAEQEQAFELLDKMPRYSLSINLIYIFF